MSAASPLLILPPSPPGPSSPANPPGSSGNTYAWMLAWLLIIALLAFANQTALGHTIIYYALVLILVLLLVTQYQFIASALAPIGTPAPS